MACACDRQVRGLAQLMLGKAKSGERRSWYQLSGPQRRKLEALGKNIAVTGDFGRPYRCLVHTFKCAL
jgi:hypothetical protein